MQMVWPWTPALTSVSHDFLANEIKGLAYRNSEAPVQAIVGYGPDLMYCL